MVAQLSSGLREHFVKAIVYSIDYSFQLQSARIYFHRMCVHQPYHPNHIFSHLSINDCIAEGALRASDVANPPLNMHNALIFQGVFVCCAVALVSGLRGKQVRREQDELRMTEMANNVTLA